VGLQDWLRPGAIIVAVTELDVAELLDSLVAAQLDFVVIGGLAARAWGVPGQRKDLDVVLNPDPANLAGVAQLVVRLSGYADHSGMRARSPEAIATALRSCARVLLNTRFGDLDVVNRIEGVPSYDALRRDAVALDACGVRVPVCSLAHLESMKRTADRESDRRDLEQLTRSAPYSRSASPARWAQS
jgi:hypothetical protein